jgi:DNA-binding protein Fis
MITKESLKINLHSLPALNTWISLLESNKQIFISSDRLEIDIHLLSYEDIKNFAKFKHANPFSIFIIFYDENFQFNKIINYISCGAFYFIPASSNKNNKEKLIKSIAKEIYEPWFVINPFNIEFLLDSNNLTSLTLHLNQLAKKIAQSTDNTVLIEEEKSSLGLGYLLFFLLKKHFLPDLQFIKLNSDFIFQNDTRYFIQSDQNQFIQLAKKSILPKNSIFHIYHASQNDFINKYQKCFSKNINILLPPFHEFQNGIDTIFDFLTHLLLNKQILLSQKAYTALLKKSYLYKIINLENLLKKINNSKCQIITENLMTSFMEGGKKNLNQNFSHYFMQVLISNASKWKNGNIYDCGKALLEKILINNALEICQNHKKNAAKILGINRNTLREKKHNN